MTATSAQAKRELAALADQERAANLAWFFKTGKGEYGEGDRFLGIPVPVQRKIAARYRGLPLPEIALLLQSRFHEHRFVALAVLVGQFRCGTPEERQNIAAFYLRHTKWINNWDLVDASAPYILGEYVKTRECELLYQLARSPRLWERRMAMVSTFALIKNGEVEDAFRIAELLLPDTHDLIHKAVGWALRETGVISRRETLQFLQKHYREIPRTALRYAIEHLPSPERKQALSGVFFAD